MLSSDALTDETSDKQFGESATTYEHPSSIAPLQWTPAINNSTTSSTFWPKAWIAHFYDTEYYKSAAMNVQGRAHLHLSFLGRGHRPMYPQSGQLDLLLRHCSRSLSGRTVLEVIPRVSCWCLFRWHWSWLVAYQKSFGKSWEKVLIYCSRILIWAILWYLAIKTHIVSVLFETLCWCELAVRPSRLRVDASQSSTVYLSASICTGGIFQDIPKLLIMQYCLCDVYISNLGLSRGYPDFRSDSCERNGRWSASGEEPRCSSGHAIGPRWNPNLLQTHHADWKYFKFQRFNNELNKL